MHYPQLNELPRQQQTTDAFGGYNHNLRPADGEWFDMKNLTSDHYPVLSPRGKRGIYAAPGNAQGLIAKDALCWVDGSDFVINDYHVDLRLSTAPKDCPKQLVSMGAYVVIMPDKKYVNTADLTDFGKIENAVETVGPVTFELCEQEGDPYNINTHSPVAPENPQDGEMWLDTGSKPNVLKQWNEADGMWVSIATTYIKISCPGIGIGFAEFDGVEIHGLTEQEDEDIKAIDGSFVLWGRGDNYILIIGILGQTQTLNVPVTVERRMPNMDFLIESNNRLWGCHYGIARNGKPVNEIYACKLGDFKNWSCYLGVATDSYTVSLGTDGGFTGAAAFQGYPVFFKENCLHKVFGEYPANYRVQSTNCRGVQKGSERSLAMVNEVLYYKGRTGICVYDGSLPSEISSPLGTVSYSSAVGGGHGNKYYVSMTEDKTGQRVMFVFDADKHLWHKEDGVEPLAFCSARNELYFIDKSDGKIKTVLGSGEVGEETVEWMAETGRIGLSKTSDFGSLTGMPEEKYLEQLILRLMMDAGAELSIAVQYDDSGSWEPVATICCRELRSYDLPILPKRCDHLRLRLEGKGDVKLFSITRVIEGGSTWNNGYGRVLDF